MAGRFHSNFANFSAPKGDDEYTLFQKALSMRYPRFWPLRWGPHVVAESNERETFELALWFTTPSTAFVNSGDHSLGAPQSWTLNFAAITQANGLDIPQ